MSSSRFFKFTDPCQYQATLRAGEGVRVCPTTKGDFRAEIMQIDLSQLWMQRVGESLPRILLSAVTKDRAAIEFCISQPRFRHHGIDVSSSEIVVMGAEPTHRVTFAPGHCGAMSLTPTDLAAAGRALIGRELARPSLTYIARPAPALRERLVQLYEKAAQLAKVAPDRLTHPEVARSLEEALIHAMIRCLSESTMSEADSRARGHAAIISKFEEFLEANCFEPIYLSEVCVATGVSEQTLRRCCHEHLGMGPVRYLWLRRMNLVRPALLRADPATATVTGIATDHGFWELGRFSVEYRALFGESPSASLRRLPDNRCIAKNRPSDLLAGEFA